MLRNTPRNEILKSPSQRLFSRATRTILPMSKAELQPNELEKLRVQQSIYADRVARPAVPLNKGEKVRLQTGSREWIAAKVVANTQYPRSVIVETNNGNALSTQQSSFT